MALDLLDRNPFPTSSLSLTTTSRPGFTFNPDLEQGIDFSKYGKGLDLELDPSILAGLNMPSITGGGSATTGGNILGGAGNPNSAIDMMGNLLMSIKDKAGKNLAMGYAMKTAAAAGNLFSSLLTYTSTRESAKASAENAKQSVENKMLALDNQILYYKNQITDKFAQLMARNTVSMATKNLRVSAGALLEQTKDAAYDATKDIQMLESNAELKKISLRSEAKQAKLVSQLQGKLATANVLKGMADLGLMVGTGYTALKPVAEAAGGWGNLWTNMFGSESGSLNETVYGG